TLDVEKSQQPNELWPMTPIAKAQKPASRRAGTARIQSATRPSRAPAKPSPAPKPAVEPLTAILSKVDDSTIGVGWTGIEGDQLLVMIHPEPGKDEPAKIPLMDVSELVLKRGGSASTPITT